jgi:hypothetical protein
LTLVSLTRHDTLAPLQWKDDHPTFNGALGKVREKIRKSAHDKARLEATLNIRKTMLAYQNFQYIYAPYYFGYDH